MKICPALLLAVATLMPVVPRAVAQTVPAAQPPPGTAVYKCPSELCEIKVDADACTAGSVRVDRPLVVAHDVTLLRRSMTASGHGLDEPGVRVDAPGGEFEVRSAATPNEARLFNRNSIMGEFLYRCSLQVRGCPPLQAWIGNVAL